MFPRKTNNQRNRRFPKTFLCKPGLTAVSEKRYQMWARKRSVLRWFTWLSCGCLCSSWRSLLHNVTSFWFVSFRDTFSGRWGSCGCNKEEKIQPLKDLKAGHRILLKRELWFSVDKVTLYLSLSSSLCHFLSFTHIHMSLCSTVFLCVVSGGVFCQFTLSQCWHLSTILHHLIPCSR